MSGLRDEWLFKAVVPEKCKTIEAAYEFCVSRARVTDCWKRKSEDPPTSGFRLQQPVEPMEVDEVKRGIKCFKCGRLGHMKKDCRVATKKEEKGTREQRNAGKRQVWKKTGSAGGSAGAKETGRKKKFDYKRSIQELTQQLEEMNKRMNKRLSEGEEAQEKNQDFQ